MQNFSRSFQLVFLLLIAVLWLPACVGGPQKAVTYGAAMTDVYSSVNDEAVAIRDTLSADDAVRLADAMIVAGEALRAYNLAAMAWYATGAEPADYAVAAERLRLVLGQAITMIREIKACSPKL